MEPGMGVTEPSSRCADCGIETWPYEVYMISDELWHQAGGECDWLCVGCVEQRLGRELESEDFPALPVNDDADTDSVLLRLRKGSGRAVEGLYVLAKHAVADLGVDVGLAASALGLESSLLLACVNNDISTEVRGVAA
jgi:hypothetical protein